jgi:hypothetical protein
MLSRNRVEVARRIEPEEGAESVGEGGDCNEEVLEKCDVGKLDVSRDFRPNFRMATGNERKLWLSVGNGELLGEREEGVGVGVV